MDILRQLKNRSYFLIWLSSSVGIFSLEFYLMNSLPISWENMCIIWAWFNIANTLFSSIISILIWLIITWIVIMYRSAQKQGLLIWTTWWIWTTFWLLTLFCWYCPIPLFSYLGFSVFISLFAQHDLIFKLLSIKLLILSIYFLDKKIKSPLACKIKR